MWFDETGLPWVNPSPNMRTLSQALLYPGVALLEGLRNYSVGRGTDTPFEFIGADWIDGRRLADELSPSRDLSVYPVRRTPSVSNFKGQEIDGLALQPLDRDRFQSVETGLQIALALARLHADRIDWDRTRAWIGDAAAVQQMAAGDAPEKILSRWRQASDEFKAKVRPFLLYPDGDR